MKRQDFVPETIIDEDVPAFMGALAQASKDGKKEFKFGDKTYKVKLKKDVADKITKNMSESEDIDDLFIDDIISDIIEATAADYAKLSNKDLSDLFDIFKNVGRSAAKPVIVAIKKEIMRRSVKEGNAFTAAAAEAKLAGKKEFEFEGKKYPVKIKDDVAKAIANESVELEEGKFDKLQKKLGRINPETLGDVMDGKIKLNPAEKKEFDEFMKGVRKMFASESVEEAYDSDKKHTMDPKSHVELNKETGMYCVYNAKSEKVSEFESKKDAEEYAIKNHDELMKESTDLEEAALPFKELEKAWIRTKGNDKKREKLIKKKNLKPLISNVRPGAIKLGPLNALNAKGKENFTMAGLDADGELIFISNNPTRIHYPSNTKDRPKGEEMNENNINHRRLIRIVEVSLGERPENTNEFIKESNINLTMTPSIIQKAYNKFTRGL